MLSSYLPAGDVDVDERFDFEGSVASVLKSFSTSLALAASGPAAVPLVLYFALKIGVLVLYVAGVVAPLASFWALFIREMGGDELMHYPAHLNLMLKILGRFDILLGIFVQILFTGATIRLLETAFRKKAETLAGAFAAAGRRYGGLVIVAGVSSIAMLLLVNLPGILARTLGGLPGILVASISMILGLAAHAIFVFAAPLLMVRGGPPLGAIVTGLRIAARYPVKSLLLVTLPFILTLPTLLLSMNAELISFRLSPDFMVHIQAAGEIMHLVSSYLVIGGATVMYCRLFEKRLV